MSRMSSRDRLEQALARIADPKGEGARACLTVYADSAKAAADAADARTKAGQPIGPLDGVIVSIKDLFDVKGEVTRAGSKVLVSEGLVAKTDAPVIARLKAAGAVVAAKTNMSEFAFSGVGANPHYGTPGNPFDRARVPGGSTSGGAVAVADGMCEIAIGTDTGGSTRIPAALCGIVGWKPSKQRVPTDGAFPLSFTLDSIGPMAKSVADCALADAIMAGQKPAAVEPASLSGLRFGIWHGVPFDGADSTVTASWTAAVGRLTKAGVKFSDETIGLVDEMAQLNAKGGFSPTEAFALHRERLKRDGAGIDSMIRARIERGGTVPAYDYIDMTTGRRRLVQAMDARFDNLDVLVLPTVPIVAPKTADMAVADEFGRKNAMLLRNTSMINFFDLCAISLPLPRDGGLSTGLMLVGRNGSDAKLFSIAAAVEKLLAG
ncbi:amidase [Rhodoplanes sp. Z2-YC6860]|uniref:amidase n=1 Tax=Rhodoplanes sp. Z2-YC6860 TaxID=674703 RepID=UPI00078B8C63|nr:amidase, Asp-tRNAAsn/Glu-tRNAGln amidotransferase A subunit [Rhodoplanes sp. Z2-YC6860]